MAGLVQLVLDLFSPAPIREPVQPSVAPPANLLEHPQATRRIQLRGHQVFYLFKRSRRRTIGMAVGPDGLEVSAPRWVPLGEIEAALLEKQDWILRKLQEMHHEPSQYQQQCGCSP